MREKRESRARKRRRVKTIKLPPQLWKFIETGLPLCPPEKKAGKLAREIQWDTFSGPV
jgi:hypothetical protein